MLKTDCPPWNVQDAERRINDKMTSVRAALIHQPIKLTGHEKQGGGNMWHFSALENGWMFRENRLRR